VRESLAGGRMQGGFFEEESTRRKVLSKYSNWRPAVTIFLQVAGAIAKKKALRIQKNVAFGRLFGR
jgi:hypothetical protein